MIFTYKCVKCGCRYTTERAAAQLMKCCELTLMPICPDMDELRNPGCNDNTNQNNNWRW